MKSLNYNEGKMRPSLILQDMKRSFDRLLEVRENGAIKYDRLNWAYSIGTPEEKEFLDANLDSLMRHIIDYANGEAVDKESGCLHLAHAAVRCMFAIEYHEGVRDAV